ELQDFAYVVSHDLKAPLRGISSLTQWLSDDYEDVLDEAGREYLDKLLIRTRRMYGFIEGILQYSRAGRVEANPERLDAGEVVREVIDNLSPPDNITVSIDGVLPEVVYDRMLLGQLFQNLISNAVKHLDKPSGEVTVSCADLGDAHSFCVRDNGVGIEKRHFERIYKIFQSLKPRSEADTTGVGLSLVKKIAERHGGAVHVESTVGEGSAFYFTIPRRPEGVAMSTARTVLIIDDSVEFSDVARTMISRKGYDVLCAASGREAYEIIEAHDGAIHAALFDVNIPGEDPIERYERLRILRPEMKIIICTGGSNSNSLALLEEKGVEGLLTKPFRMEELSRII
ncbi:MAG: response regulator, partial [Desulfobacterales bacterium]|nr:response regulator [Desulfobacterales bacterium]